jgi:hypothetical protein
MDARSMGKLAHGWSSAMKQLTYLAIVIGAVTTISSCNRDVYLVAREPVPFFQSPADAVNGSRPIGQISTREKVRIVDCLDMKGLFVLEVAGDSGAKRGYVMNGKYDFNTAPYCHD